MIKLDENKVNSLKNLHWEWFWTRAINKTIDFSSQGNSKWSLTIEHFFSLFFDWTYDDLEKIILADSEKVMRLADQNAQFYKKFKTKFDILASDDYLGDTKAAHNVLMSAFGYDDFLSGITRPFQAGRAEDPQKLINWHAYAFTESLGIDVCPYCNRQYVFTLKKDDGRPEIDHFFPKSMFPYLSCTLSNFIPSCHQCNHQKSDDYNIKVLDPNALKKDVLYIKKQSRTIYPYRESFDSMGVEFKLSYQNKAKKKVYFSFPFNKNSYEGKKIRNSINAFHLRELYNGQQIEINDLLERYKKYSEPKIRDILKTIIYPSIQNEIEDLKKHLTSVNDADVYVEKFFLHIIRSYIESTKNEILGLPMDNNNGKDFPFRKFKQDIIKQLENERLINNQSSIP